MDNQSIQHTRWNCTYRLSERYFFMRRKEIQCYKLCEAESKRELELLDRQMAEIVLMQNSLEEKMGMAVMLEVEGLTKDLVDGLC